MIISVLQLKGGAGKTTIAVNVAKAVRNLGYTVLLVDADSQGSARDWHDENGGSVLNVVGLDRPTIDKDIKRYERDYEYIFIDAPPHLSVMTTKIIISSDVVIIPVQPSPYDVWASKPLVDLIKQRQDITGREPRTAFVISRQITQTNIGKEVRGVLEEYGLPVLKHGTFQRVIYPECDGEGTTVVDKQGVAHDEIMTLTEEILEFANDNT